MTAITPEIVMRVAHLARLRLEGESLQRLAGQLDEILAYVQQLQALPVKDTPPTSHVLPLTNVLRGDEPSASLPQEAVTALAPARQVPFIKVPKVIETS